VTGYKLDNLTVLTENNAIGKVVTAGFWESDVIAALLAGAPQKLIIFEPDNALYASASANYADESNVEVCNATLSDKTGEADYFVFTPNRFSSLLKPKQLLKIYRKNSNDNVTSINVSTVQSVCEQQKILPFAGNILLLGMNCPFSILSDAAQTDHLSHFDVIIVRQPKQGLYESEQQQETLSTVLQEDQFICVQEIAGDAMYTQFVYVRDHQGEKVSALQAKVTEAETRSAENSKKLAEFESSASQFESRLVDLTTLNSHLDTKLAEINLQNDKLRAENAQQLTEKEELATQVTALQEKQNELVDAQKDKDTQIAELTAHRDQQAKGYQETRQQAEALKAQNDKLSADSSQLRSQVEKLNAGSAPLKEKNEKLNADNTQLKAHNENLNAKKTEQKTQVEKFITENRQVKEQNQKLSTVHTALKDTNEKLSAKSEELKEQNGKLAADITQLKNQNETLNTESTQIKEQKQVAVKAVKDELRKMANDLRQLNETLVIRQTELEQATAGKSTLQEQVKALGVSVSDKDKLIEQNQAALKDVKDELQNTAKDLHQANENLSAQQAELEQTTADKSTLQEQVRALGVSVLDKDKLIEQNQAALKEVKDELQNTAKDLHQANENLSAQQAELKQATAGKSTLQEQVQALGVSSSEKNKLIEQLKEQKQTEFEQATADKTALQEQIKAQFVQINNKLEHSEMLLETTRAQKQDLNEKLENLRLNSTDKLTGLKQEHESKLVDIRKKLEEQTHWHDEQKSRAEKSIHKSI
jgi:FkbM family methyltransferase